MSERATRDGENVAHVHEQLPELKLILATPNRRSVVAPMSAQEAEELYILRIALECVASANEGSPDDRRRPRDPQRPPRGQRTRPGGGRHALHPGAHRVDDERWVQFGPGAVGVGWDLGLLGLRLYLAGDGTPVDPAAFQTWSASDEAARP